MGIKLRRRDGDSAPLWDYFFQSAIANAVASFAGNRRVFAGGNYSGTASAMMLQGTSGTLQIQVNNLGAGPCTRAWRSAIDASGLVA